MELVISRSLLPIQGAVQPLMAVDQKGVSGFSPHDQPRGRIRFLGYGSGFEERMYGPCGRELTDRSKTGGGVDIYV
jgi:hypothetical protein